MFQILRSLKFAAIRGTRPISIMHTPNNGAEKSPKISMTDNRIDYRNADIPDSHPVDPFQFFDEWFKEANNHPDVTEANAMAICTASQIGQPSCRMVLLKKYDSEGFIFFSNYNSRKGCEISENPNVALLFYWQPLSRQVRIEGTVSKISAEDSDNYFASRPVESQYCATISNQSEVIPSRNHLHQRLADLHELHKDAALPRPNHWGGYRVKPRLFEFWAGFTNRLHDRLQYTLASDKSWSLNRLAP